MSKQRSPFMARTPALQREQRLHGKVALVTGGASGIGRSTGLAFAAAGATVLLIDRNAETKPRSEVNADASRRLSFARVDLTDESALREVVHSLIERRGTIDIVVNCAAIAHRGRVHEITTTEWSDVMANNLTSTFAVCREVLPMMMEARRGSIVNMSSGLGISGSRSHHAYAVSKAGIVSLTRCIARAYGQFNIRANAICPGSVATPMHARWIASENVDSASREDLSRIPMGRLGTPAEVAAVALFLASDESSYTNGAVITVDGGERA